MTSCWATIQKQGGFDVSVEFDMSTVHVFPAEDSRSEAIEFRLKTAESVAQTRKCQRVVKVYAHHIHPFLHTVSFWRTAVLWTISFENGARRVTALHEILMRWMTRIAWC